MFPQSFVTCEDDLYVPFWLFDACCFIFGANWFTESCNIGVGNINICYNSIGIHTQTPETVRPNTRIDTHSHARTYNIYHPDTHVYRLINVSGVRLLQTPYVIIVMLNALESNYRHVQKITTCSVFGEKAGNPTAIRGFRIVLVYLHLT